MNLIGVFVTKLWPVQALACDGGDDGGDGGATKNIISPKFSIFGDIITTKHSYTGTVNVCPKRRSARISQYNTSILTTFDYKNCGILNTNNDIIIISQYLCNI